MMQFLRRHICHPRGFYGFGQMGFHPADQLLPDELGAFSHDKASPPLNVVHEAFLFQLRVGPCDSEDADFQFPGKGPERRQSFALLQLSS